jgi:transposase
VLAACLSLKFACEFTEAALALDQAGWNYIGRARVAANIGPLPPKCPELNPQENVWQFLRENWLWNRVFASYGALVEHYSDVGTAL